MAANIFISYRREDSAVTCGRIYDRLVSQFGKDTVFKDVDSIHPGTDFRTAIRQAMKQSAVQLVVIGPQWVDSKHANGRKRLNEANDTVRLEIEQALAQGIAIIPVLVQGASMPSATQLPDSLRSLAYRHALPVRYDPDFDSDVSRLIITIDHLLQAESTFSEITGSPPSDQLYSETKLPSQRQQRSAIWRNGSY